MRKKSVYAVLIMTPRWLLSPLPLRITIPVMVLLFSLIYDVINTWVLVTRETRREYLQVQRVALAQAAWLADAVLTFQGMDNGFPMLDRDVRMLMEDRKVTWAVVCDANRKVRYSTRKEWVGQEIGDLLVEPRLSQLAIAASSRREPSAVTLSRYQVAAAQPMITDDPDIQGWVSMVTRDPYDTIKEGQWEMIRLGGISAFLHLIACAGLWWLLHAFLSRRVNQLLESTLNLTGGAIKSQPLSGRDEFAQIAHALREGESIFQQLVENIRDVIYLMSADRSKMLYLSPAFEEMWGVKPNMSNPEVILEQVVIEDRLIVQKMLDPLIEGKKIVNCEYRIRRPDGEIRWLESRAFPVLDMDGKMHRIAGLTTDVTERKILEQQVLEASESERRRLGHDIHDDLCQRLAAVKLGVEMITDKIIGGKLEDAQRMTASSSKQIGEAATLARNLARGLSPVNLEGEGLLHAITKMAETSRHLYNVPITLDVPDSLPIENATTATHLYRIAQELINNAARHANPTSIQLELVEEENHIRLQVNNDGESFSVDETTQGFDAGMGLRIIRYRANAIGASIQFLPNKRDKSGTYAICLVPLTSCKGKTMKDII